MQDVVPPPRSSGGRFGSKPYANKSQRRSKKNPSTQAQSTKPPLRASVPGAPVVELDWRLPARLRRPVSQELERQRRRRRAHQAVVQFERRPLYNDVASKPQLPQAAAPQTRRQAASGYQVKNPAAQMNLPPYVGAFTRQLSGVAPRVRKRARTVTSAQMQTRPAQRRGMPAQKPRRIMTAAPASARRALKPSTFPLLERDVPFGFEPVRHSERPTANTPSAKQKVAVAQQATASESVVVKPKRRFALPLHFSIWPKNDSSTGVDDSDTADQFRQQIAVSKKKRRNHALM